MPIGGSSVPIWHQNWKEDRQQPRNNPSEFHSSDDLLFILAVLGCAIAAVVGYVALLSWLNGFPFP